MLKRQLRRALKLGLNDDLDALVALQAGGTESVPGAEFASFVASVEESYAQLDRDLALRTRSLDISSQELFAVNARLRVELTAMSEAESALRQAASQLARDAGLPAVESGAAGLQCLSRFISELVHEREEARAAQALSEQRLKLALTGSNLGLWDWNCDESSVYFDRSLCQFLGIPEVDRLWPTVELAAQSHQDDLATFQNAMRASLRSEIPIFNIEHRVRHAKGHWVWLQTYGSVSHRAPDGRALRMTGTFSDVTERKLLEQAGADNMRLLERTAAALERAKLTAESAVETKSRFLANMSHELRTPLNGVVGMASLLEATELGTRQRSFVRTLKSSADALVTIINDILDLSKIEAGKLEIAAVPVDVREEVAQVTQLFGARAHDKGIELAAHFAAEAPRLISGDPTRLRQILANLIGNAIKFTDRGAVLVSVRVLAHAGTKLLEFSVSDTGVGIRHDQQRKVFEAFEQADGSITRRYGGTGLGLAICQQLVTLMHGAIGIESEPGRGSRFHFTLPCPAGAETMVEPIPQAALAAFAVGSHATIRAALCETLSAEAVKVFDCAHIDDAADLLRRLPPHLRSARVVLDVSLDREASIAKLRAAAGDRALEIIVLVPTNGDVVPPAGVARVLVKPVCTPDVLESRHAVGATSTLIRAPAAAPGSRGRALVVEDNPVNQELARAMLEMMGFSVVTAGNGRSGVNAAEDAFDIILMDCQMPVMDGLEAARTIRAREAGGRRVPIVALTGNAMPGDREICVAAGMDDYLSKPFGLAALRSAIDRWVPVPNSAA